MKIFSTFSQLNDFASRLDSRIVVFGAGNIARKTLEKSLFVPHCILDNNYDIDGTIELSLSVTHPSNYFDVSARLSDYFLICTTSINEIVFQLLSLGVSEDHIILSPHLNQVNKIAEFETQQYRFLVASGLQNCSSLDEIGGGGLYFVESSTRDTKITKIINSPCHGITVKDNHYFVVSEQHGVAKLDSRFNIVETFAIPTSRRPHGIAWCDSGNIFVMACSYSDSILLYDHSMKFIDEIPFSNKYSLMHSPQHHCNDVFCLNGIAYVSMFSVTGNWKRGIFDGGLLEIDLKNKVVSNSINLDLKMPHSISTFNDELCILDSLNGRFLIDGLQEKVVFNGFARGYCQYSSDVAVIGLSKNRNYTKLSTVDNRNISLDNCVVAVDVLTRISKTFMLPSSISEVHALAKAF